MTAKTTKKTTKKVGKSTKRIIAVHEIKSKADTKARGTIDLRFKKEEPIEEVVVKREPKIEKIIKELKESIEHPQKEHHADTKVKHFDLNEKINFKRLHGKPLNVYRKISISFVILTGLLLAVMVYFSLVKVDIAVVLNRETVKGNSVIDILGENAINANGVKGVVRQVAVEDSREFKATGKEVLGQEVTGRVKLVNNYVRTQPLVASTRLLTEDGQLVRIKETVSVPAGGSVEVAVYSEQATSSINIPANAHLTIPGLWQGIQDKIYAETTEAVKYQEKVKMIITQADIDSAVAEMTQGIQAKADEQINQNFKDQYSEVINKVEPSSITVNTLAKAGEEKDIFSVSSKAMAVVVAFNEADIKAKAQEQLVANLPAGKTLMSLDDKILTFELGTYDINNSTASVNVGFAGEVVGDNNSIVDKSKLIGLTAGQLEKYLSELPGVASYEIKFTPGFIDKVPSWIDRINVDVVNK